MSEHPILQLFDLWFFTWGLIWGSFLNVLIVRIPKEENIHSKSHCVSCGKPVRWFDNIPLVSFMILRGKCRHCSKKISWQYPLVELLTAIATLIIYKHFGLTVIGVEAWILTIMLIALIKIDLDVRLLPNVFTYPGTVIGLLFSLSGQGLTSPLQSILGFTIGFGFFFSISWLYVKWKGVEGLGGGDIKLLGMLGAFLGVKHLPLIIIVSSLTGTLVGVMMMIISATQSRKSEGLQTALPFGPFLAAGAWVALFWGDALLTWYLSSV